MLELQAAALPPGYWIALAAFLGLAVGSFLNVVIHRLPRMLERQWHSQCAELGAGAHDATLPAPVPAQALPAGPYNLMVPRSACPACGTPIRARDNVPVLSYLRLRGRCAACSAPIGLRYPLVELATAILTVVVAWHFGPNWTALAACGITWTLIALTMIDFDHQLLPDALTLPLLWAGLVASLWWSPGGEASLPVAPRDAIIGAAAGYLSLWSVYHLFRLLTGKEGMGYGDFKLLAALGAWLGWRLLLPIVLASALVGALTGIALILLRRHGRGVPMPFGPFLAAAGWLVMLWGRGWVDAYLASFASY
jgi:leader peptidase (prepilin peptidase)/N-methyltransferase